MNELVLFCHLSMFDHICVTCVQEALSKAAVKKSRTPVQLDLGDMLAALEKQQQAMRARQLNNTKPLTYTGTHTTCVQEMTSASFTVDFF